MSDDDLIRRGDALECFMGYDRTGDIKDAIAALPPAKQDDLASGKAVTVGVPDDVRDYAIAVSEAFDTMMEVALNPFGAWQVIQAMAGHIAALEPVAAPNPAPAKQVTVSEAEAIREAARDLVGFLNEKHLSYMSAKGRDPKEYRSGWSLARDKAAAILALIQKGGDAYAVDPRHAPHEASPGVTAGAIPKGAAK